MNGLGSAPTMATVVTLALFATPGLAEAGDVDAEIARIIGELTPELIRVRRDLHAHPELAYQEVRTAHVVAARFRSLGLEVGTGIAGTGVLGILRGERPGPVVAMRGDMDALPIGEDTASPFASKRTAEWHGRRVGVMHACGHDIHTTMLLGVAEVLARLKPNLAGTVLFVAQPAEEDGDGAQAMLKDGVFDSIRPEAMFAYHVDETSKVGFIKHTSGNAAANCDGFQLTVKSVGCHGAGPHMCVDPILVGARIVLALQEMIAREIDVHDHTVITVGSFNSGSAANIIPQAAALAATVRTYGEEHRVAVRARITRLVHGLCSASDAQCDLAYEIGTPSLYNDPRLQREILPSVQRVLGGPQYLIDKLPEMGGEDFSYFAREIPSVMLFLGAVPRDRDTVNLHSPTVVLDEASIAVGVQVMAAVIYDYLGRHAPQ